MKLLRLPIIIGNEPFSPENLPIIGPVYDYNVCVDLLYLYCHVNNFTVIREEFADVNKKNIFKIENNN